MVLVFKATRRILVEKEMVTGELFQSRDCTEGGEERGSAGTGRKFRVLCFSVGGMVPSCNRAAAVQVWKELLQGCWGREARLQTGPSGSASSWTWH